MSEFLVMSEINDILILFLRNVNLTFSFDGIVLDDIVRVQHSNDIFSIDVAIECDIASIIEYFFKRSQSLCRSARAWLLFCLDGIM